MPFYLKEVDVIDEVVKSKSVLIVPCRFCPAVSRAVTTNQPFIDLYHGSLKTKCYEDLIANMQSRLDTASIHSGFDTFFFQTRLHIVDKLFIRFCV